MMVLLVVCTLGLLAGFLLLARAPKCQSTSSPRDHAGQDSIAILIPARNEEHNLPRLLASIPRLPYLEVIVIDDNSTDRTREIAESYQARVIAPSEPPEGITGKAWACACGADSTSANHLLFLDADTFFVGNGLEPILATYAMQQDGTVLSVLPFAITERPYEELSLFFNLLMAFGAGGFGVFQPPRLFGQSLLLPRTLYRSIGGHTSVGQFVLENFHMSRNLEKCGAKSKCFSGRGVLSMRMFPAGVRQLCNGWTKGFANGATSTDTRILITSILWLSALTCIPLLLLFPQQRSVAALVYLCAAVQVAFFAREIGTFRPLTCFMFPVPLLFFFVIFARSTLRRILGRSTDWRGRHV